MARGSKKPSRDVAVGAMFALALIILAMTVMILGDGSNLFRSQVHYFVVFPSVEGMGEGSPVKMSGVQIGSVTGVELSMDATGEGIEVEIGVDANYRQRIRTDSKASLKILQLLSGEKYVELSGGTPGANELPDGAMIELGQDRELLSAATAASVWVSTAESTSSRMRISGRRATARLIDVRCRCPPERVTPRSPSIVWY